MIKYSIDEDEVELNFCNWKSIEIKIFIIWTTNIKRGLVKSFTSKKIDSKNETDSNAGN